MRGCRCACYAIAPITRPTPGRASWTSRIPRRWCPSSRARTGSSWSSRAATAVTAHGCPRGACAGARPKSSADIGPPPPASFFRVGHPLDIVPRYLVALGMIPSDAMERSATMDGGSHMTDRRDLLRTFGVIGGAKLPTPSPLALPAAAFPPGLRAHGIGSLLLAQLVAAV